MNLGSDAENIQDLVDADLFTDLIEKSMNQKNFTLLNFLCAFGRLCFGKTESAEAVAFVFWFVEARGVLWAAPTPSAALDELSKLQREILTLRYFWRMNEDALKKKYAVSYSLCVEKSYKDFNAELVQQGALSEKEQRDYDNEIGKTT